MKKSELKQIIKEEIRKALKENFDCIDTQKKLADDIHNSTLKIKKIVNDFRR